MPPSQLASGYKYGFTYICHSTYSNSHNVLALIMNVLISGDSVYIKSGREDSVKKETASLSLECRGGSRGIGKTGPHKAGVPWKNGISMLNSGTVEESLTSAYRGGKKWKYNERLCPPGVDADKPSGSGEEKRVGRLSR